MTPRLSIRDLSVRYGDTVALSGVGLDVAPGEKLAVIDPFVLSPFPRLPEPARASTTPKSLELSH